MPLLGLLRFLWSGALFTKLTYALDVSSGNFLLWNTLNFNTLNYNFYSLLPSFNYISCCVIRPAFRCCAHLKAGRNLFFQPFSSFFVQFLPFSVISRMKSTKTVRKWTKKSSVFSKYSLLRKAGRHAKAGRLPEGVPRICLFSVDFLPFQTFFSDFRLI